VSHIECEDVGEAGDEVGCDGPGAGAAGDVIAGDPGDPGVALAEIGDLGKGKEGVDAVVDVGVAAECNDTGGAGTGEQLAVTAFVQGAAVTAFLQGDEDAAVELIADVAADIVESIDTLAIRLVAAGTED